MAKFERSINPYKYGRGNKQFVDGDWCFLNLKISNDMRKVLMQEAAKRTMSEGVQVSMAVVVRDIIHSKFKDSFDKLWGKPDEEFLRQNYKNNPTELSKVMNKSADAIRSKARRMGLAATSKAIKDWSEC